MYDRKKKTSRVHIGHFAHDWIGDYVEIDYTKRTHDVDLLIEDIRTEKVLNEI